MHYCAALATYPEVVAHRAGTHAPKRDPPLFGLAPCGVCPATAIAGGAVRSYRTFSPLPACLRKRAVYFLLHWPSLCLEAQIPGVTRHTALRSPDFPPPPWQATEAAIVQPPADQLYGSELALQCRKRTVMVVETGTALPSTSYGL